MDRFPAEEGSVAGRTARREEESSVELVRRARQGDRLALDRLYARYRPRLQKWAGGRLPRAARGALDTEDIVQDVLHRTLSHFDVAEFQRDGALLAYLRQAILNRIRDEVRRLGRRPAPVEVRDYHPDPGLSPFDELIGRENRIRYEQALAQLRPFEQEAVIARFELDATYEEIAAVLGKSSPDAARMIVGRALLRLAKQLGNEARAD